MAKFSKLALKRRITTALELPKDIMLDLPCINAVGDEELVISNHKGIAGYTREQARVKTSIGEVAVWGKQLVLKEISKEIIVIVGKIEGIGFKN